MEEVEEERARLPGNRRTSDKHFAHAGAPSSFLARDRKFCTCSRHLRASRSRVLAACHCRVASSADTPMSPTSRVAASSPPTGDAGSGVPSSLISSSLCLIAAVASSLCTSRACCTRSSSSRTGPGPRLSEFNVSSALPCALAARSPSPAARCIASPPNPMSRR